MALRIGKNVGTVYVHARDGHKPPRIDRTPLRWILDHVGIGDVVYDLTAGSGLYAVIAAKHRGATVVAFEPGYDAFKDLCDNLLLNGCDGAVAPLPVALADFEGLGRLKFPLGQPGQASHTVHAERWRPRRPAGEGRPLLQPVCATPLDRAVERYALPPPNHLRISNLTSVNSIIAGAAATLTTLSTDSVRDDVGEGPGRCQRPAGEPWLSGSRREGPQARAGARALRPASVSTTAAATKPESAVNAITSRGR